MSMKEKLDQYEALHSFIQEVENEIDRVLEGTVLMSHQTSPDPSKSARNGQCPVEAEYDEEKTRNKVQDCQETCGNDETELIPKVSLAAECPINPGVVAQPEVNSNRQDTENSRDKGNELDNVLLYKKKEFERRKAAICFGIGVSRKSHQNAKNRVSERCADISWELHGDQSGNLQKSTKSDRNVKSEIKVDEKANPKIDLNHHFNVHNNIVENYVSDSKVKDLHRLLDIDRDAVVLGLGYKSNQEEIEQSSKNSKSIPDGISGTSNTSINNVSVSVDKERTDLEQTQNDLAVSHPPARTRRPKPKPPPRRKQHQPQNFRRNLKHVPICYHPHHYHSHHEDQHSHRNDQHSLHEDQHSHHHNHHSRHEDKHSHLKDQRSLHEDQHSHHHDQHSFHKDQHLYHHNHLSHHHDQYSHHHDQHSHVRSQRSCEHSHHLHDNHYHHDQQHLPPNQHYKVAGSYFPRNTDSLEIPDCLASKVHTYSDPHDEEKKRRRSELLARIYEDVKSITRPLQHEKQGDQIQGQSKVDNQVLQQPLEQQQQQIYEKQLPCSNSSTESTSQQKQKNQRRSLGRENDFGITPMKKSKETELKFKQNHDYDELQYSDHAGKASTLHHHAPVSLTHSSLFTPTHDHRPRGFSDSETDFLQNFLEQDWFIENQHSGSDDSGSISMTCEFDDDPFEPNLGWTLYQRVIKPKGKKIRRRSYSRDNLGNISLAEYISLHGKSAIGARSAKHKSVSSQMSEFVQENETKLYDPKYGFDDDTDKPLRSRDSSCTIDNNQKGPTDPNSISLDGHIPSTRSTSKVTTSKADGVHHVIASGIPSNDDQQEDKKQNWKTLYAFEESGKLAVNDDVIDPGSLSTDFLISHLFTSNHQHHSQETGSNKTWKTDLHTTESSLNQRPIMSCRTSAPSALTSMMPSKPEKLISVSPKLDNYDPSRPRSEEMQFSSIPGEFGSRVCPAPSENKFNKNANVKATKSPPCLDERTGIGVSQENMDISPSDRNEFQKPDYLEEILCGRRDSNHDSNFNNSGCSELSDRNSLRVTSSEDEGSQHNILAFYNKIDNSSDIDNILANCHTNDNNNNNNNCEISQGNTFLQKYDKEISSDIESNYFLNDAGVDHFSKLENDLKKGNTNNSLAKHTKSSHESVENLSQDSFRDSTEHSIFSKHEAVEDLAGAEPLVRKNVGRKRLQDTAVQTSLDLGDTVDISGTAASESSTVRRCSDISKSDVSGSLMLGETAEENRPSKRVSNSSFRSVAFMSKEVDSSYSSDRKHRVSEPSEIEVKSRGVYTKSPMHRPAGSRPNKSMIMRSKSLHGDKDVEENKGSPLNLQNPSLSGSLKELSHLNIDVSQKLVDGEKRFVVTNGSPEMQVVVNALTPVLLRRSRSGRRSDKNRVESSASSSNTIPFQEIETQNGHYSATVKGEGRIVSPDESIVSNKSLPIYARLRSHDGSVSLRPHKTEADNGNITNTRKKNLYRISDELKQISQMPEDISVRSIWRKKLTDEGMVSSVERKLAGRSEDRYLVKDINTTKESLFINPKFSHTWHGHGQNRSDQNYRPAPRMGVGMVFADSTKFFAGGNDTRRYRNTRDNNGMMSTSFSSTSGTSSSIPLQTYTLPVISRTLLDAMHKRYCAHQYARQNATMLQPFSLLRLDPASSQGGEPITALRVEPKSPHHHEVVQVNSSSPQSKIETTLPRLTSDGESDVSSSATDSLQSSPRQIHVNDASTERSAATTTSLSSAAPALSSSSHHHPNHDSSTLTPLHGQQAVSHTTVHSSGVVNVPDLLSQLDNQPRNICLPTETESSEINSFLKEVGTMTSQDDECHETLQLLSDWHRTEFGTTSPSSSPRPDRLHPGAKNRAELEAVEAIQWLRAAGFPQYAQMFEDGQFPIELALVEKDHDFLDKDSMQSLFRRLETLNKYAGMKLDAHQRKKAASEDDEDDDICALSERWQYQKSVRRWSRKDLGLSSKSSDTGESGDLTRGGSHDSLLADQDSGSQTGDSPLLDSKMPHQEIEVVDGASQQENISMNTPAEPPNVGNNPISPKLRRAASERIKTAKNLWKKMEGGLRSKKSRRQRNILEISGPVVADQENMQAKLQRLNCVDISPTSPDAGVLSSPGFKSGAHPEAVCSSPTSDVPASPHIQSAPSTNAQPESVSQAQSRVADIAAPTDITSPSAAFRSRLGIGYQSLRVRPTYSKDDSSDVSSQHNASSKLSGTSSSTDSSSLQEYYNAQSQLQQTLESSGPARKDSGNDPGLVEIFVLPQDHQPGMFPRVLQNGYIETDLSATAVNSRSGSVRLGRDPSRTAEPSGLNVASSGSAGHPKRLGNRVSVYDNFTPAGDSDKGLAGADKPVSRLAGLDEDSSSISSTGVYQSHESKERSVSFDSSYSGQKHEDVTRRPSYRELRDKILSEASTPSLPLGDKPESSASIRNDPSSTDTGASSSTTRVFTQSHSLDSYLKDTGSDVNSSHSRKSSSGSSTGSHGNKNANTSLSEQFSEFDVILQQLFDNISDLTRCMGQDEMEPNVQLSVQSSRSSDVTVSSATTTWPTPSLATVPSSSSSSTVTTTSSLASTSVIVSTSSSSSTTTSSSRMQTGNQRLGGLIVPSSSENSTSSHQDQSYNSLDLDNQVSPSSDSAVFPNSPLSPTSMDKSMESHGIVDKSLEHDHENSSSGGGDSHTGESISDQEVALGDLSHDDSLEQIPAIARERRDSGVGHSLTRVPTGRKKIRWHSFQRCHRPDVSCRSMQINSLTVSQMVWLRKLSLLKLTGIMERCLPVNKSGWNWVVPKFMKKHKTPDFSDKNVFGVPLSVMVQRSGQPIPQCVLYAMRYLRRTSQNAVGIFRRSGVKSKIQSLIDHLEANPDVTDFEDMNAYNVADMLKTFFRELPECLLTNKLSETFRNIYTHVPQGQRLEAIQAAILILPDENREVLQSLLLFLSDISIHQADHQMNATNLAVCFTPTVFMLGARQNTLSHSPKRLRKNAQGLPGVPDPREIMEQKTSQDCLLLMITECKRLFTVPPNLFRQVQTQSLVSMEPPQMFDLCGDDANVNEEVRAFGQERVQMVLKEAHDKNRDRGWISAFHISGIDVSHRKSMDDYPLREWKLVVDIDAPPIEVLRRLMHERHTWDEDLLSWSVVEKINPHSDIFQYVLNSMAPHPHRHFCVLRYWRSDLHKGACALITMSVEHTDAMEVQGVRAVDLGSFFLMEPCGSGRSRLTHITRVDTRGRRPEWYSKVFGHITANFQERLRDSFKQEATGPETKV